jgi:nitroimidazol reductase NimA-like FMN-containing flavoprotein (pyridoxamine 5'-phosphate oxidase superfamily)
MRNMTDQETREFLAHNKFGVLSLADQGRAYALPLFYGYDGRDLYVHTRPGLKNQYARMTSEACFTVVRVMGLDDWASVHVFGKLERVGDGSERMRAFHALMSVPLPPEFGESAHGEPLRTSDGSVTYRLVVARSYGRYSETPGRREGDIATRGM